MSRGILPECNFNFIHTTYSYVKVILNLRNFKVIWSNCVISILSWNARAKIPSNRDYFHLSLDRHTIENVIACTSGADSNERFHEWTPPLKLRIIENNGYVIVGTTISRRRMDSYSSFMENRNRHRWWLLICRLDNSDSMIDDIGTVCIMI